MRNANVAETLQASGQMGTYFMFFWLPTSFVTALLSLSPEENKYWSAFIILNVLGLAVGYGGPILARIMGYIANLEILTKLKELFVNIMKDFSNIIEAGLKNLVQKIIALPDTMGTVAYNFGHYIDEALGTT